MTGPHYIAIALSFALVISKTAGAGAPAPSSDRETDQGRHPLFASATPSPTDAPDEIPGESHDCTSCHAIDPGSDTNQFTLESDDPTCPHLDMHHTLYGSVVPYPTAAPYSNPGELYACLSCHEVDTSSGTNQFLVERDCQVCHDADSHHMLYGSAISYPTDAPYSASVEQYVCLSCHEIVTSSGRNQFLVERDCQACHHATRAQNVIVDIRPGSSTFMQCEAVELGAENRRALFIPTGFAHGFQTLTNDVELYYEMTDYFRPELAGGFRWNDDAVEIEWPMDVTIVNDRDLNYPDIHREDFAEFSTVGEN